MEHLGIALKALFSKQQGDSILRHIGFMDGNSNYIHLDSEIEESQITQLLLEEEPNNYSIDQLSMTGQVVLSKWMVGDKNHLPFQFANNDSVFNILLHFSSRVLTIKDGDPICRYNSLLRWHKLTTQLSEDLFTTSYLASRDIMTKYSRRFFDWDAYLGHDCKEVNALFQKDMAELHMHLKGSSYNFDISWIYLMNHIEEMRHVFDEISSKRKGTGWDDKLYLKVRNAAIIRYYLAGVVGCVDNTITKSQLRDFIKYVVIDKNKDLIQDVSSKKDILVFQECLNNSHRLSAKKEEKYYPKEKDVLDYISVEHHYNESVANLIMASERFFMYKVFNKIYSQGDEADKDIATLFYAYVVYKDYFRHTILQLNNRVGFSNFANYEDLKTSFIGKEYYSLLYKAALEGFCKGYNNRYIEARIVPDDTPEKIIENLSSIYDSIDKDYHDRCSIIFHFIKKRDESYNGDKAIRNNELRTEVKRKAYAIYRFRQSGNPMVGHVVGIDAANSEIYARPEVFAQAFRFLRGHDMKVRDSEHPYDLNITYHVGEDFLDLADGLRAIEESIIFLGLGNGDRLGHALALGTNVRSYYANRRDTICESKQIILDNLAWLHHKCVRLMGYTPLCGYLEEQFHKYFIEIYDSRISNSNNLNSIFEEKRSDIADLDDINDYYLSWLLRGNSPTFGSDNDDEARRKLTDEVDIQWLNASINHHKGCEMALRNANARELFDRYHSREMAKNEGAVDTFTVRPIFRNDYYTLLEMIQDDMLNKIERKHIAIECNPTSNYKIGEMERYDQHPIVKYFNYGLNTPYKQHNIAVSINTDDQGVFATSLEREYSLMALALENNELGGCINSPRTVVEWLNRIREMSVEQRFNNN